MVARRGGPLMLEIVNWNMNHWQRNPQQRAATWAYLDEIAPDVALLQECVPPSPRAGHCVYRPGGISPTRPWGAAVVSRDLVLSEVAEARSCYHRSPSTLLRTHPGTMAIADVEIASAAPITVVSLYGLIEESYAITTLHHLLSDLTPLFDSDRGARVVLGGDLNCSTQLGDAGYRDRYRNLFDRIRSFGMVDLAGGLLRREDVAGRLPV